MTNEQKKPDEVAGCLGVAILVIIACAIIFAVKVLAS
jgi:hypothetical protein